MQRQFGKQEDDERRHLAAENPRKRLQPHRESRPRLRAGRPAADYHVVDGRRRDPDAAQSASKQDDEAKARAEAQEHVWNEIWKRRIVYFATVGASFGCWRFRWSAARQRADEFTSPIRWVSDMIRLIGALPAGLRLDLG